MNPSNPPRDRNFGNLELWQDLDLQCVDWIRHHVANWPGVTVEKRYGHFKVEGTEIRMIPGTYSLSAQARMSHLLVLLERSPKSRSSSTCLMPQTWNATST